MNFDFSISTEGLEEKGKAIKAESDKIKEALSDIDTARKTLEGWVSSNKERFENKMMELLPKMNEMTEVIDSYGNVAVETSSKLTAVENKIASAIDNNYFK